MILAEEKAALFIDLEKKEAETKIGRDLFPWLGGLGVAVKIYSALAGESPLVFANGPFTLAFPFAPFTCALFRSPVSGRIEESYLGGSFGAFLGLAGYDALVIRGKARRPLYLIIENEKVDFRFFRQEGQSYWRKEGLAGWRSILESSGGGKVDDHFSFGTTAIGEVLRAKNLWAVVVSGSSSFKVSQPAVYNQAYRELLDRSGSLPVKKENFPSCFGCPLGCRRGAEGRVVRQPQKGGLGPFLVACPFIGEFYTSSSLVFSLLSLLGNPLSHEELELLPERAFELRRSLL